MQLLKKVSKVWVLLVNQLGVIKLGMYQLDEFFTSELTRFSNFRCALQVMHGTARRHQGDCGLFN